MTDNPEFDHFKKELQNLRRHDILKQFIRKKDVELAKLTVQDVAALMLEEAAKYFLLAAANLNRTALKAAAASPEATIVEKRLRPAQAVKSRLPVRTSFDDLVARAEALRQGDLGRKARGGIEAMFRARLQSEGIPVLMSPPVRAVPTLLVSRRKPDGIWPDPSANLAPRVYLELKNVRRVSDDIQKRLYEIAEASLEMKWLYGNLDLRGMSIKTTLEVLERTDDLRTDLRRIITAAQPVVVALLLCPVKEAERYRAGAQAFIDRVFFQEEIEECLAFLRDVTRSDFR